VCIEDIEFNADGTIVRRGKSLEGPTRVPGVPEYSRPKGTPISLKDGAAITGANTVYRDSAASGDKYVVGDMASGTSITISGVDGGSANANGKGNRAMLVFNYSTASNLPKMRLTVNGKSYSYINFPRTGGRSFFAEAEFTAQYLNPGTDNTIVLSGLTGAGQGFALGSVEVILFDDSGEAAKNISIDGRADIRAVSVPGEGDADFAPKFSVKANSDLSLTLYVAAYDAKGRILATGKQGVTLGAGGEAELQASISYANKDLTYKFFIWDSKFVPLTAVTSASGL
jgi:hypothetical protein